MSSNLSVLLPDSIVRDARPLPVKGEKDGHKTRCCQISNHYRLARTSIGSSTFDKIPFNVDQLDRFYDKTMACSQCMATFGDEEWDTEGYQILAMKCPSKKKYNYFSHGLCYHCAVVKQGSKDSVPVRDKPTKTKKSPRNTRKQTREKSSEVLFDIIQELKGRCDLDDDRWIERVWDEMRVLLASTGSEFQKRHPEINFKKIQKPSPSHEISSHRVYRHSPHKKQKHSPKKNHKKTQ